MKKVISVENMRKSDSYTIENLIESKTLMYNASLGIYENCNWFGKIAVFCGSGNNAGDGYSLACILKENNYDVDIVLIGDKFSEDGLFFFNKAKSLNVNILRFNDINCSYDIIVDCLLGTGFNGNLKNNYKEAIEYINNSKSYVVSADINSGLNGDNGLSNLSVISDKTISIGYYKTGLFLNMAKDLIKDKINVDIKIELVEEPYYLLEKEDVKDYFKPRKEFSNKGNYGYVGILGGSKNYPGAPRLANLGQTALYSGCGVSKLIVPEEIYELMFSNVLETVINSISSIDGKMIFNKDEIDNALKGLKALSIGVGWDKSDEYKKILEYILLNYEIPVVIDADGINVLSQMDLDILNKCKAKVILTPHLKELSRLLNCDVKEISENIINKSVEFVRLYNVVLLVKGPTTIICDNTKVLLVDKGTNGMATAGSGDVLTGILTGLLGSYRDDLLMTTAVASYINGYAGEMAKEIYGDIGMVSSDTARFVSRAIKEIIE